MAQSILNPPLTDPTFGCRIALLPQQYADGTMSWDTSRYLGLQAIGRQINHYCVEAMGMTGVEGSGGIDPAGMWDDDLNLITRSNLFRKYLGDNFRLRIVIYAPKSKYDNDTLADYKDGLPIVVTAEEPDTESNDDDASGSKDPPPAKRRKTDGGMGLMTSKRMQTRTRNLGGGWFIDFDSLTSLIPAQSAAGDLEKLYSSIVDAAANQLSTGVNATEELAYTLGGYSLNLSSEEAISWTWILNFAADTLESVSREFAVLFKGEAYRAYWDIAAVTAVLTTT